MTKRKIGDLNRSYNSGFSRNPQDARSSKGAVKRTDGEMYDRPKPNPFTGEWARGYDDGIEGRPYSPLLAGGDPQNYRDGYEAGQFDAEDLDRLGSSNA